MGQMMGNQGGADDEEDVPMWQRALKGGLQGLSSQANQQQKPQGQASPIGIPQPQFQDMTAGYAPQKNKFFGGY